MTSERGGPKSVAKAGVDDDGIHLAAEITEVVDVYFGERRIWSVNPLGSEPGDDGRRHLPWPPVLKRRLRGRTEVSICRHLTQERLLSRHVAFAGNKRPLRVVDGEGNWLTVTKWGSLAPAFVEVGADDRQTLVTTVARLLADINAGTSLHAFAAYGTLLGAVRSGTLLSHDHDADIAYLGDADNPADLLRESFALQRFLRQQGWTLTRKSNGFLAVALDLPSGRHAHIDIFSAHFSGDRFYLERWVSGALARHHLVPLGDVELEGTLLAAPRVPESLLACTYGESWSIPDPSFKYHVPRHTVQHFDRWVGPGGVQEFRRWNRYHEAQSPDGPQPGFADWVRSRLSVAAAVVDLGCGAGDDALRYASAGHAVLGVDYSTTALDMARSRAADMARSRAADMARSGAAGQFPTVEFEAFNLLDLRRLLLHGSLFACEHPGPRAVTARLLLDALSPEVRRHVWWLCRTVLLGGSGSTFLEIRAGRGVPRGHRKGAPWQTRVNPARIFDEVALHGGKVEEVVDVPVTEEEAQDGVPRTGTVRVQVSWPAAS